MKRIQQRRTKGVTIFLSDIEVEAIAIMRGEVDRILDQPIEDQAREYYEAVHQALIRILKKAGHAEHGNQLIKL